MMLLRAHRLATASLQNAIGSDQQQTASAGLAWPSCTRSSQVRSPSTRIGGMSAKSRSCTRSGRLGTHFGRLRVSRLLHRRHRRLHAQALPPLQGHSRCPMHAATGRCGVQRRCPTHGSAGRRRVRSRRCPMHATTGSGRCSSARGPRPLQQSSESTAAATDLGVHAAAADLGVQAATTWRTWRQTTSWRSSAGESATDGAPDLRANLPSAHLLPLHDQVIL